MLISACFGFSTEDPMIQISAFRFPARSGPTPRGHRIVFFRVFFPLKNPSLKKYDFWLHFDTFLINFMRISSILDQIFVDLGPFLEVFLLHFFNLKFPIDLGRFPEEKMVSAKTRIPRKPSFYLVKTMVLKVRQVMHTARHFE